MKEDILISLIVVCAGFLVLAILALPQEKPDLEQQLYNECKTHGRYIAKDFVLKCELFEFRRLSK